MWSPHPQVPGVPGVGVLVLGSARGGGLCRTGIFIWKAVERGQGFYILSIVCEAQHLSSLPRNKPTQDSVVGDVNP